MAHWKLVMGLAVGALGIGALVAALGWLGEFVSLALAAGAGWAVWQILPDQSQSAPSAQTDIINNKQAQAAEAQVKELSAQLTKREWEQRQLSDRLVEAERAVEAARLEVKNAEARAAEVEGQIPTLAGMKAEVESLTGEHGALVDARDKAQDDFLFTMAELVSAKKLISELEERISDFEHMLAYASQWYEEMTNKLAVALEQAEVAQDQLAQTLAAIRAATGINGDLSPETAEEMLRVWKEHFAMETALAAEAAACEELKGV